MAGPLQRQTTWAVDIPPNASKLDMGRARDRGSRQLPQTFPEQKEDRTSVDRTRIEVQGQTSEFNFHDLHLYIFRNW